LATNTDNAFWQRYDFLAASIGRQHGRLRFLKVRRSRGLTNGMRINGRKKLVALTLRPHILTTQRTIDTKLDNGAAFDRFNVNIVGPHLHGLLERRDDAPPRYVRVVMGRVIVSLGIKISLNDDVGVT